MADALYQDRRNLLETEEFPDLPTERVLGWQEAALRAQTRERRRLGQMLHDSLCQDLLGPLFALKAVSATSAATQVSRELKEIAELLDRAVTGVRKLAMRLNPEAVDAAELLPALQALAARVPSPIVMTVTVEGVFSLPRETTATVLHLAEEFIDNLRRHAGASQASVHVERHGGGIALQVNDDGRGFEPESAERFGLALAMHRVESAGGTMLVESQARHGTKIRCVLPLSRSK